MEEILRPLRSHPAFGLLVFALNRTKGADNGD
jgi:hypothetical protein